MKFLLFILITICFNDIKATNYSFIKDKNGNLIFFNDSKPSLKLYSSTEDIINDETFLIGTNITFAGLILLTSKSNGKGYIDNGKQFLPYIIVMNSFYLTIKLNKIYKLF